MELCKPMTMKGISQAYRYALKTSLPRATRFKELAYRIDVAVLKVSE